jgi:hypothetical protein
MAQRQHRIDGNERAPAQAVRANAGRSRIAGIALNPGRWLLASLVMVGLLCGPALSQVQPTDVPKHATRRPHTSQSGSRHARKGRRGVAQVRPKPSPAQAQPPLEAKAQPPVPEAAAPPSTQAQSNSIDEPRSNEQTGPTNTDKAESTLTDAANAPATRPREATQNNVTEDTSAGATTSPELNAFQPTDSPAWIVGGRNNTAQPPEFMAASSVPGILTRVNPLGLILDSSSRVFVETVKNEKAHNKIISELRKYPKLNLVATPEEADFIISYTDKHGFELAPGSSTSPNGLAVPVPIRKLIGEMIVYTPDAKREGGLDEGSVVWRKTEDQDKVWLFLPGGRHPATNLTRHFIKALRRQRGEIR